VEIFARMVTSCASTCPLENDGEMGVRGGDVDDLTNTVDRTRFERNVLDTGVGEALDDLSGLFRRWDTGGNTEPFNRKALTTHLLPERKLEGELTRVDVQGIQCDTDTDRNIGLDLGNFGTKGCGVVMASSSQLDMVTGGQDRAHKTRLDGRRCHTCDHNRRFTEKS
jgi:hypothetical protein